MGSKQRVRCANVNCKKLFRTNLGVYSDYDYVFCTECRNNFGYKVLVVETKFGCSIRELLISRLMSYRKPELIADSLGISVPTIHKWVKKFFDVKSFEEFKRRFLCSGKSCISISKDDIPFYCRQSFFAKLKSDNICYCSIRSQGIIVINLGINDFKVILSKACKKFRKK